MPNDQIAELPDSDKDFRTSDDILSQFVIKIDESVSCTASSSLGFSEQALSTLSSSLASVNNITASTTTTSVVQGLNINNSSSSSIIKTSFPCENCGNVYNYKTSLARHVRFECGKAPQFKCPFCDHRTKHKSSLTTHIDCKHRQEVFLDENQYWQEEFLSLIKQQQDPV